MEEKLFWLMHRDDPVCTVSIDPLTGQMLRVSKPSAPELLPLGGCIDAATLRKWWQRRAVPVSQGKIRYLLEQLGIATPQEYLVKNLGLSLSDHYWIKPLDMELGWSDINLFINDFRDSAGTLQQERPAIALPAGAYSPISSTQGDLEKQWLIVEGKRRLRKGNHGSNSQESLNEVAATLLHQKQGKQPYVAYHPHISKDGQHVQCICDSFTSEEIEFIPAIDVVESKKKRNATSMYEHFIGCCTSHVLSEASVRSFLEYQVLTDFVLTNTDRHLNNFGVLRNTQTLEFVAMAPIFDSGNSMFWDSPTLPLYSDLTDIQVNSFRPTERKLLQLVQEPGQLDLAKLPTIPELKELYSTDPLIVRLDSILLGYEKKIDLLQKYLR